MCGIIARVGMDAAADSLVSGLENLEYRGYDSAGVAVQNGDGITVLKRSGQVAALKAAMEDGAPKGGVGIGHTRWSTHGRPTDENAHPHTDCTGGVAVVHNGVIENHDALRRELEEGGHAFESETDTEVVPHLFRAHLDAGLDGETAFRRTVDALSGSYALAALVDGEDAVYAARRGSPLVLGLGDEEYFLASDVPAFLERTDRVVYFEDGDLAVLRPGEVRLTDERGEPVEREPTTIDWDPAETGKGAYDHYMLKEIHAQPGALSDAVRGRIDPEGGTVALDAFPAGTYADVDDVQFVACGTSYHAALYGARSLTAMGVRARAVRASEYVDCAEPVTGDSLVVAVTQSGETADTLEALRAAKVRGARTATVTNVVGSSVAREADRALCIRAGPEIGVAATKTFSSQVVALSLFALRLAEDLPSATPPDDADAMLDALSRLPSQIESVLQQRTAAVVARRYRGSKAYFFIGRGLGYPVALEGALKFKEITYEHAEGFAAGELKHGPLALVTPETPVVALFTGEHDEKTLTNAREAQTRGADVIAVALEGHPAASFADAHLPTPKTHPAWGGLLANVQLQLLSYHAANQLGRAIDKPRNLAKSVTVE